MGAAAPVRLVVPAAGVDAVLAGAGLDPAGSLVPPADPAVAGWYTGGPRPGRPVPPCIAGHVDWAGAPAVFAGLADIAPARRCSSGGPTEHGALHRHPRRPRSEERLPGGRGVRADAGAEIRLITCGGAFDRAAGSYEDNVVVDAVGG